MTLSVLLLRAGVLWGKHDGDGKQLLAWQSMASGFSAALLGPTVTNPFDVVKVCQYPHFRSSRTDHSLCKCVF